MMPKIGTFDGEQAIAQMDEALLENRAGQLLGRPLQVTDWQVTLLGGLDSSPMAGGVYKVAGTAVTAAKNSLDWCLVVKILRSPEGLTMPDGTPLTKEMAEDPNNFGYWRREALAAQSDLFNDLPAGLRVPRFLGITHINECECWLWQEYLPEDRAWTWEDYRAAAFRLGQWQGTAVSQIPHHPWLSRNWLAGWVHGPLTGIFGLVEGIDGYNHPLLTTYFAPEELIALRQLWADRQSYLDMLAQLPKTLCHLDAHRGNLSWQGDELAMLDWAFVGSGALGEELAAFIGATLLLDYVLPADAKQLEQVAFEGYIAGLRAVDWSGDEALIWKAYQCVMPLRFAPPSIASMLRTAMQPEFAADWEYKTGKPLAEILAHRAGLVRFYLSRLDEKHYHTVVS
ncbi:MAG: phosphotransferase [Anaerolineales bacterium]|nr:phosphotransferase [Anaerolineales bacterium]